MHTHIWTAWCWHYGTERMPGEAGGRGGITSTNGPVPHKRGGGGRWGETARTSQHVTTTLHSCIVAESHPKPAWPTDTSPTSDGQQQGGVSKKQLAAAP